MSTLPVDNLELQALKQRNELHDAISDLRTAIADTREKLRVTKQVREHMIGASIGVLVFALLSGYIFSGMFTRH